MKNNRMKEKEMLENKNSKTKINENTKKFVPLRERESISPIWIFLICANQIALNFVLIPLGTLTSPMCTKLGLSHFTKSMVLFISPVTCFIVPPIVSALSDSTTLKFGRRRIYLIIGEIFVVIGLLFICFCREISKSIVSIFFCSSNESIIEKNTAIFYFIAGEILALVGGSMINGPGKSMCAEIVPPSQKVLSTTFCVLDSSIAGLISNSIGAFKLYQYTRMSNETFVLLVSLIIGVVAMTVSVISSPEEQLVTATKTKNPIKALQRTILSLPKDMIFVFLSVFFLKFGSSQFFVQGADYIARTVFHGDPNEKSFLYDEGISYYQFLMLIMTISQMFFSSINTKIIGKLGFKNSFALAVMFQIFSNFLLFKIKNKYLLIIPYIFCGFNSVSSSVPMAFISLRANEENLGSYVSLNILVNYLSVMCSNLFIHMILGSLEFFQEDQGRLIAFGSLFCMISIFCALFGCRNEPSQKKKVD